MFGVLPDPQPSSRILPDVSYEKYIRDWHAFVQELVKIVEGTENQEMIKKLNMYVLNQFYVNRYDGSKEFYFQFYQRLEEAKVVAELYK